MPSSHKNTRRRLLKGRVHLCIVISLAANFLALNHPPLSSAITCIIPSVVMAFEPVIPSRPSYIAVENVSQKYPVTLMNKLFSSVPKREYAVQNINLSFGHNIRSSSSSEPLQILEHSDDGGILLVGRSASGKSTLLRLLAGMELPMEGYVSINKCNMIDNKNARVGMMPGMPSWAKMGLPLSMNSNNGEDCYIAQPVILQGKPEFDDTLTVLERIVQMGHDTIHQCSKELKRVENESAEEGIYTVLENLATDFASLLTISEEQCSSLPSKLSPSGQYLFGIACTCMVSIAPVLAEHNTKDDCSIDDINKNGISYPILLLDELFDTEVPSTVDKCNRGILNLIRHGGVVISATHRPAYFEGMASRTVTLNGGKVLRDEKMDLLMSS